MIWKISPARLLSSKVFRGKDTEIPTSSIKTLSSLDTHFQIMPGALSLSILKGKVVNDDEIFTKMVSR